jgi:phage tail sheath gpL-like
MSLKNNTPETMIPGNYVGYNFYKGPNGLPSNVQKLLLVGDTCGGTLAADKPTEVYSESEVLALCGAGSVLHREYLAAKAAWKYAVITLVRHADVTGSAASWKFVPAFSGAAATKSGVLTLHVGKDKASVAISVGTTPATLVAAVADAINAKTELPVTAVATVSETESYVTFPAKNKGAYISSLKGGVLVSYESTTAELTAAVTVTDGTGTVDLTSALAAVFPERYHIISIPVCDSASLALVKEHLDNAAGPLEQRGQRSVMVAVVDSVSAAKTLVGSTNDERVNVAVLKNSVDSPAFEITAALGSVFSGNSKPNVPMNDNPLTGVALPAIGDKWSGEEQEALLRAGIIPLVEKGGKLVIVRAVTTRNAKDGVRFTKLVDTGTIAAADYTRDAVRAMHDIKYKNKLIHKRLAGSLNEDNIFTCKQLEKEDILRYVDENADDFITEEDTSDTSAGRMLCQIPSSIVPGLNQICTTLDIYV